MLERGTKWPEDMKCTGHERDFSGGITSNNRNQLDYMHARYYAPVWGRFLSVDPGKDWDPEQPQSWNMYAYVRNNPVNRTDPTGKYQCVGGNDAACNKVALGLEKMKKAAAAMKKNDPQRKALQQVINAYGAPGDPNTKIKTVWVNPTNPNGTPVLPKNVLGQSGQDGLVAISLVNLAAKAGGDSVKAFTILGGTMTHEGKHQLQAGFPTQQGTVPMLSHLHKELQAYTLAKGYYEALNSGASAPDPTRGAWASTMEACRQAGCTP